MQATLRELVPLVLEALPSAALIASKGGRIVVRSAAAAELLPAGADVATVLHAGTAPAEAEWQSEMAALAEGAGRLVRRNVRLVGKGGRLLLVDLHLRSMGLRLAGEGGQDGDEPAFVVGRGEGAVPDASRECVLVVIEDISGRASMERRLAACERLAATSTLAARVAHELNNPLDGALRYLGLAERVAGPEAGEHLANARAGLMRMAEIIRSLMAQGRGGQASAERAAVPRLLDDAVATLQPQAQAAGVAVVCDLDGAVEGLVDASLYQVFCNVIKNAVDAMPAGGRLTIRVRAERDRCVVEFADTGCGLTAAEAERIFEPFYTTKGPGEGSGLGLAICRDLVSRVGGTIEAAPRPQGGAMVTVRLPLPAARKPPPQE